MKIDSFQAKRAPVGAIRPDGTVYPDEGSYKTMNLAGLYIRENGVHMQSDNKGRYYHDGRFKTPAGRRPELQHPLPSSGSLRGR